MPADDGQHTWTLDEGTMVEHFRVLRPLGRGGMAEVYLARDTRLGRRVALKMIQPEELGALQDIKLFLFEARTTARFSHPNIVVIHAVGEHAERPYVALEYLEGQSLRERMMEDPPGAAEIVRLCLPIAEALVEAHARGIIHRDLKPENVMLGRDGRVRVLDFGLARVLRGGPVGLEAPRPEVQEEPLDQAQTMPGMATPPSRDRPLDVDETDTRVDTDPQLSKDRGVCGTPVYMGPEQWRSREVTGAADIWALGVILFELLTLRRPFEGRTLFELADLVCKGQVPRLKPVRPTPPELVALVGRCLQQDPGQRPTAEELLRAFRRLTGGARAPLEIPENPFRGLLSFGERHSHLFFGREAEIAALMERLREEPVLPVVGPSGAGKSSFVQAGVVPRLREHGPLAVVRVRPGSNPLQALALATLEARQQTAAPATGAFGSIGSSPTELLHPDSPGPAAGEQADADEAQQLVTRLRSSPSTLNLELARLARTRQASVLLCVDQLEEVYTLAEDSADGRAFMQAVCTAADDPREQVRVIFTLREEFLSRLAEGPEARKALSHITVLRSPGPEALEQTLLRPVAAMEHAYQDPDLVREMVAEVSGEVSCLPLLQFTGSLLWERRDQRRKLLLRSAYEQLGGVAGALATHADGVLAGMTAAEVQQARAVLLRLVTDQGTRRVLSRSRVLAGLDPGAEQVLLRLVRARLLSATQPPGGGEAELELVHESLISSWAQLSRWLEEGREELAFLAEVEPAADTWVRRGRRDDEVLQGQALRDSSIMLGRLGRGGVPEHVRHFIEAGQRRYARGRRRRRVLQAVVVATLALVALGATVMALAIRQRAQEARQAQAQAEERRREADSRRAEAEREAARSALARGDLLEARARLRSSLQIRDSPEARALWRRLRSTPLVWRADMGGVAYAVAYSPDGKTLAAGGHNPTVHLFDVRTGVDRVLRGLSDQVFGIAYRPDGRGLAASSYGGEVRAWDLQQDSSSALPRSSAAVWSVRYSPDSKLLAVGRSDGSILLWRPGGQQQVLRGHQGAVSAVAFAPDGKLLASAGIDKAVLLWDLPRGTRRAALKGHTARVSDVAFAPDGKLLASAGYDHMLRLWDPAGRAPTRVLGGHSAAVLAVAFGPDGRRLASGSSDRSVRIWDLRDGRVLRTFDDHQGRVWDVAFDPDGRHVASASEDRNVRIWSLARPTPMLDPPARGAGTHGHSSAAFAIAFSPDGRMVASASADRTVQLWDVASGRVLRSLRGHTAAVHGVAFSPDGRLLISGGDDQLLRVWDPRSGAQLAALPGHTGRVCEVVFSPDGRRVASSSSDRTVQLWDVGRRARVRVLRPDQETWGVAFSPDGKTLAAGTHASEVWLWDARSGQRRQVLRGHKGDVYGVAFAPGGRRLASGGADHTVRLWDLRDGSSFILGRHPGRVYFLAFDPRGGRVGAPASDGVARIWDLPAEGQVEQFMELRGHHDEVNFLRYSPDGRLVATSSDDGTLRLWESDTGRPAWRSPLLRRAGPELLTHRGWIRLDGAAASQPAKTSSWRRAVARDGRLASESDDGGHLCLRDYQDTLQIWDLKRDRRLSQLSLEGLDRVLALPSSCVSLARGVLRLHPLRGPARKLLQGVTAVARDGEGLLAAAGGSVVRLDRAGATLASHPGEVGVTALVRVGQRLALGFSDGSIELRALDGSTRARAQSLEDVPTSQVLRLLPGPPGTLVAGYADGQLGLWSLGSGARIESARLHGPVLHLLLQDNKLHAASDLGQHLTLDLSVFAARRCELLREVWSAVPVVWEAGLPRPQARPSKHICSK